MITRPIPKRARRIVDTIRREVPRPSYLPLYAEWYECRGRLRWVTPAPDCRVVCPLGLLSRPVSPAPIVADDLPAYKFSDRQVAAFWRWWDEQYDPKAAVEAVWG